LPRYWPGVGECAFFVVEKSTLICLPCNVVPCISSLAFIAPSTVVKYTNAKHFERMVWRSIIKSTRSNASKRENSSSKSRLVVLGLSPKTPTTSQGEGWRYLSLLLDLLLSRLGLLLLLLRGLLLLLLLGLLLLLLSRLGLLLLLLAGLLLPLLEPFLGDLDFLAGLLLLLTGLLLPFLLGLGVLEEREAGGSWELVSIGAVSAGG